MKKLTVFVLVLMYALAMVGCDQNQNNRDYIFGSWEAEIEMSILGVSVADEEGPQSTYAIYNFDFFEDGTGESGIIVDRKYAEYIADTNESFTYILDGNKLTLTYDNGKVEKFTVSFLDEKLILDGRSHIELSPKKQ